MNHVVIDEVVNHIISESSKLAQNKNKIRHDWVGNMIHWEQKTN